MATKGWISPYAFQDNALSADALGRAAMQDGFLTNEKHNKGNATNSYTLFVSRNTIAYTNTTNKTLFVLPADAIIIDVILHVTTAFNSSGTDAVDVGYTAGDPDEYVDALDCSSAGINRCGDAADMPVAARGDIGSSDVTVLGKFTQSVADATAGEAVVEIIWALPT